MRRWDNPNETKIGEIGESLGLDWGGNWKKFKDPFHFGTGEKWEDLEKLGPCPRAKK